VGKTQMLEAMHRSLHGAQATSTVVLTTASELVGELIAAIRAHGGPGASRVHSQAAVVLVDDLHTLVGMPVTQQEVALWVAAALDRGARIACTSGSPPQELPALAGRLAALPASRVVEMRRPSGGEMRRILEAMGRSADVALSASSVRSIVARCEGDVRRALGAIALHRFCRSAGLPRPSWDRSNASEPP
jgi:chromosomal replication initiation ATPase DnaA